MKILIIEDNANKLKQIKEFFYKFYPACVISESYSFKNGLNKVYEDKWNLIILDMTLPTYDITHAERGGEINPFAGKDIMKRMLNREIYTPVIIITQFESFDGDRISLSSLNKEFEKEYSAIWRGSVFYENDEWKATLKKILEELEGEI